MNRANSSISQTPQQQEELKQFLAERDIKGHPKDKRIDGHFCMGCNRFLPVSKFLSENRENGHLKVRLCSECRENKLTPNKIRTQRAIQVCTVCQQERQISDFMGSQFEGDPYENKSKICGHCRKFFEQKRQSFLTTGYPTCPFCKEQKNIFDFPEHLDEPHLKKAQEFTGNVRFNRACSKCRKTKAMADFALYLKRVMIKASKKKTVYNK
ncbi:MAG: hypothetical protein HQK63_16260 [Desulfamplus sp.]|nr:hypothetical protein [Desulfamplus sp.]